MPKFTIDTGHKVDYPEPISIPEQGQDSDAKVYYPSLHIDGGAELKNIPEEGEALIRFKRVSKTISQHEDGPPKCSVSLEVTEITVHNYEEDAPESAQEAFDKIAKEVRKDY